MEIGVFIIVISLFLVILYKEDVLIVEYLSINKIAMGYEPTTIANYFIKEKSSFGKLTPMKVIKLTYLAYSWYLTLTKGDKSLTSEKPEAWKYGPVFQTLYNSLKEYGSAEIESKLPVTKDESLTKDDVDFLEKIWSLYGGKSGIYLSALTHKNGTPWDITYRKGYNCEIDDDLIIKHYESKLVKK